VTRSRNRQSWFTRVIALVLFLAVAARARSADIAPTSGDVTDVSLVRTLTRHPGASVLWEPYIAKWVDKHLVVAFGAGIPGKADMGDILCCTSTDDGKSWSEPVAIFDHQRREGSIQFAYANPVLYHPPGHDVIWCFAMRCPINWADSEDSRLAAAYTADGGRTWVPVEMSMFYTGPLIIVGGILRVNEGRQSRYLLPAHRNTLRHDPLGSRDQFVLESTSLLEWRLAGTDSLARARSGRENPTGFIPQPAAGKVFLHEGQLALGEKDGEVRMVMRTSRYDHDGGALDAPTAYSSISRDAGRTWSTAIAEPELFNSVAKGYYGRSARGDEIYVYNDGKAWVRKALRYKVRRPSQDWSPERSFFDAGIHNSYPTLLERAPGEFYAVWDSGTENAHRTSIRFGRLVLK
jgi:BNR repeat-like domain